MGTATAKPSKELRAKVWRDRARESAEATAKEWWDALDKDRELDWGDIVDLCMYISEAIPSPEVT